MNAYELNRKIVEFIRLLRREGIQVNQSHSLKAMRVLEHIDLLDEDQFYYALRAVLCFSPEDYQRFRRVYLGFWGEEMAYAGEEHPSSDDVEDETDDDEDPNSSTVSELEQTNPGAIGMDEIEPLLIENDEQVNLDQVNRISTYSPDEKLMLQQFTTVAMEDAATFQIRWAEFLVLLKRSLRTDIMSQGHKGIHFRKMMRKSLAYGGEEWFQLIKKGQKRNDKQMLFTLIDISGSMETYTKNYLPALYLLHRYMGRSETFFFNTNLYCVTKHFRHPFGKMMELINDHLSMVSKGTNLAQCLKLFRKRCSSQLSPHLSSVVIFSDGWDRGDLEQLEREIKTIHNLVYQIIWINPLLGMKGYEPKTQALDIVAPYLAHMVSAEDYRSLSQHQPMKWSVT